MIVFLVYLYGFYLDMHSRKDTAMTMVKIHSKVKTNRNNEQLGNEHLK